MKWSQVGHRRNLLDRRPQLALAVRQDSTRIIFPAIRVRRIPAILVPQQDRGVMTRGHRSHRRPAPHINTRSFLVRGRDLGLLPRVRLGAIPVRRHLAMGPVLGRRMEATVETRAMGPADLGVMAATVMDLGSIRAWLAQDPLSVLQVRGGALIEGSEVSSANAWRRNPSRRCCMCSMPLPR